MRQAPVQSEFAAIHLFAVRPTGERIPFRAAVYAPALGRDGDFACQLETTDQSGPKVISGVDGLQALILTLRYLESHFGRLMNQGWVFYSDEINPEPIDPREVYGLPPLDTRPAA